MGLLSEARAAPGIIWFYLQRLWCRLVGHAMRDEKMPADLRQGVIGRGPDSVPAKSCRRCKTVQLTYSQKERRLIA